MKYKDKVQKIYRYKKLVWEDKYSLFGLRRYHYEDKWSIVYYGPVFRFRYDPVPGTGGSGKVYIRGCYRAIRTTQERRWYHAHKGYVRGKRSACNLPDSWDDIHHARREKGWKRTKKRKQWMKGVNIEKKFSWKDLLVD
jgi:hypothetical protein